MAAVNFSSTGIRPISIHYSRTAGQNFESALREDGASSPRWI
jgi:hypothetical protein